LENNEFSLNANANDLQLIVGLTACGESRSQPRPTGCPSEGGKVSGVEPTPAGSDPAGSEGSAGRCDRCLGLVQMFHIQRDVDLIRLHRQAGNTRIAKAKSATHIR